MVAVQRKAANNIGVGIVGFAPLRFRQLMPIGM
jgi:hypothetical protein